MLVLAKKSPDGVSVVAATDGHHALQALNEGDFNLVITDLRVPGIDSMALIQYVQKHNLPIAIIVINGQNGVDETGRGPHLGACDCLAKAIDLDQLHRFVERARRSQDEVVAVRPQLQTRFSFQDIITNNVKMFAVFDLIHRLADTISTVLIEGETGTGKEQVARAIHQTSQSRKGPMVAVNCAALPENLLESELFGHEKGSFTGASGLRRGRFEMANGGTLFLDEIGDVPARMQAKLLRVLQERRFERVGGSETIEVDVRVIAASNRSLSSLVKEGTLREDLFYRLNVIKIDLPPLRERGEDVPLLAAHFAGKYARMGQPPKHIDAEAMNVLVKYRWPGNIRELENAIERACVTASDGVIRAENLPPELSHLPAPKENCHIDTERPLGEILREVIAKVEKQYLGDVLKKTRGNVGQCAAISGRSRRSITAKLAEYNLDRTEFKICNGVQ